MRPSAIGSSSRDVVEWLTTRWCVRRVPGSNPASGDRRRRGRRWTAAASRPSRFRRGRPASGAIPAPLARPRLHHLPHREVRRELVDAQGVAAIKRIDAVLLDPSHDRGALVRAPGRDDERGLGHDALRDGAHQSVGGVGVVKVAG